MKLKRNGKTKSRRRSSRKSRKSINANRIRSRKRNTSKSRSRTRRKSKSKRRSRKRSRNIIKYKIPDGLSNPTYDFKLIELQGCGYCKDAKKLILDNNYTLEIKQTLSSEEENEIKNKVKEYPYYPKIFKYNKKSHKYDFIGGYDKLTELLENKCYNI